MEGLFNLSFVRRSPPELKRGDVIRLEESGKLWEVAVTDVDPQPTGDRIEGVGRLLDSRRTDDSARPVPGA